MNREFVLRDNEVAINRPDGTVIIMNLNALRELKGESDETKTLKSKLIASGQHISALLAEQAKLRKELSEANSRIEKVKEDAEKAANDYLENYLEKIKGLKAENEVLRNELNSVLEERNEFYNENDRLTKEVCSKNAEIQKLQQKLDLYSKQHLVLFGPTQNDLPSTPDKMPVVVYIASTGELFFSQQDVEKAYNLAKGSVSAYFSDKQRYLYARDPWGNRITDNQTGKYVTIGLVQRFSKDIFTGRDINKPVFDFYESAVACAKNYTM